MPRSIGCFEHRPSLRPILSASFARLNIAFSAQDHWVWYWKNWIDRRFMHKYGALNRVHKETA